MLPAREHARLRTYRGGPRGPRALPKLDGNKHCILEAGESLARLCVEGLQMQGEVRHQELPLASRRYESQETQLVANTRVTGLGRMYRRARFEEWK